MKLFLKKNNLFLFSVAFLFFGCSKNMDEPISKNFSLNPLTSSVAPIYNASTTGRPIKDAYIVVFKDEISDVDQLIEALAKQSGFKPKFTYKHSIKGFAASIPVHALEGISKNPNVKYIEQDQEVKLEATQTGATWGIDRIDQTSLPLNSSYTYSSTASIVDAYIFDTGIRFDHVEFGGRAVSGYDAFGGNGTDGHGHGTHVSGTVGGSIYGVAKGVRLIAVRVLDNTGSGTWSGVVAGIDWAVGAHASQAAVGNMSLGGGASTSVDDAVRRAVADGIVMCVAAGNSTANAGNYSPARTPEAITVAATTATDGFASYSNYGSVVDILAPGSSITSSYFSSSTATATMSGTSMATPHVTGAAALYLEAYPGSSPAQVQSGLKNSASLGKIASVPSGTVNALLYTTFTNAAVNNLPSIPNLLTPANSSKDQPTSSLSFSWGSSTNAQSYNLQISTSSIFSSLVLNSNTLNTSVLVSGFTAGTVYYWRVIANNSLGSTSSDSWSFTTILNSPVLSSPLNNSTGVSLTPTLKWNAVSGATGYDIQVSTNNTFSSYTSYSSSTTSYKIGSSLNSKTKYFWRVMAKRSSVSSNWSSSSNFTTL